MTNRKDRRVTNATMPAALNALNWAVNQWNEDNQPEEWEGELKKLAIQLVEEPEGENGEDPEYFKFFVYRIDGDTDEDDEQPLIAKGEMAIALLKDIDKLQSSLADDDEDDEDEDDEEEEDD